MYTSPQVLTCNFGRLIYHIIHTVPCVLYIYKTCQLKLQGLRYHTGLACLVAYMLFATHLNVNIVHKSGHIYVSGGDQWLILQQPICPQYLLTDNNNNQCKRGQKESFARFLFKFFLLYRAQWLFLLFNGPINRSIS